jgi:hypothetical protein
MPNRSLLNQRVLDWLDETRPSWVSVPTGRGERNEGHIQDRCGRGLP